MASDKMLGSFDQKSAPEDNDLLVEYDASASKVRNVKFGGVWNWIVKKLTSAVINELQTSSKNVVGAINELNSKTRIKLIDVNMTINDKTATIKYNISDTAIGLLLISGNIGSGVFFSIVINYGTKYSFKLLSFSSSNTDTSSIVINSGLGRITFNGNSKLESFYEVNGLLLG